MGYQESYVKTRENKDFDKLVKHIKNLGEDYYNNIFCDPVEIITLNKEIKGNLDMMCQPETEYQFDKGEKFVYFSGERHAQRNVNTLVGGKKLDYDVEMYYTECFPSEEIFNSSGYAQHEEFTF